MYVLSYVNLNHQKILFWSFYFHVINISCHIIVWILNKSEFHTYLRVLFIILKCTDAHESFWIVLTTPIMHYYVWTTLRIFSQNFMQRTMFVVKSQLKIVASLIPCETKSDSTSWYILEQASNNKPFNIWKNA